MKKILQILFGLFLILVLAYFSFLELSGKIENDLLSKTKTKFIDKGITGISAEVEGNGLRFSRTLILSGVVGSVKERSRVASFIENLEGVGGVRNEIVVEPRRYTVSPLNPLTPLVLMPLVEKILPSQRSIDIPVVPVAIQKIPKVPMVIEVEKAIENEENKSIKMQGVK